MRWRLLAANDKTQANAMLVFPTYSVFVHSSFVVCFALINYLNWYKLLQYYNNVPLSPDIFRRNLFAVGSGPLRASKKAIMRLLSLNTKRWKFLFTLPSKIKIKIDICKVGRMEYAQDGLCFIYMYFYILFRVGQNFTHWNIWLLTHKNKTMTICLREYNLLKKNMLYVYILFTFESPSYDFCDIFWDFAGTIRLWNMRGRSLALKDKGLICFASQLIDVIYTVSDNMVHGNYLHPRGLNFIELNIFAL